MFSIALGVLMGLGLIALVYVLAWAERRGSMKWSRCHHASLSLSIWDGKHMLLMVYRICVALYCWGVLLWILTAGDNAARAGLYYTVWNFTVLCIYFALASYQSIRAYKLGFQPSNNPIQAGRVERITYFLFELVMTCAILVDVTLWGVLYTNAKKQSEKPDSDVNCCSQFINYGSINVHGINFFFILGELILNNVRMVPFHSAYLIAWPLFFGLVSWIEHYAGGIDYVYFFLDTENKYAPLWYIGLAIAHVLFFFLAFGISKLRNSIAGKPNIPEEEQHEAEYLLHVNASVA